jgi:hypothetical protein
MLILDFDPVEVNRIVAQVSRHFKRKMPKTPERQAAEANFACPLVRISFGTVAERTTIGPHEKTAGTPLMTRTSGHFCGSAQVKG